MGAGAHYIKDIECPKDLMRPVRAGPETGNQAVCGRCRPNKFVVLSSWRLARILAIEANMRAGVILTPKRNRHGGAAHSPCAERCRAVGEGVFKGQAFKAVDRPVNP